MQMGWIMSCLPSPASAVSCRPASSRDGHNQSLVRGVHLRHPDARTPGGHDASQMRWASAGGVLLLLWLCVCWRLISGRRVERGAAVQTQVLLDSAGLGWFVD